MRARECRASYSHGLIVSIQISLLADYTITIQQLHNSTTDDCTNSTTMMPPSNGWRPPSCRLLNRTFVTTIVTLLLLVLPIANAQLNRPPMLDCTRVAPMLCCTSRVRSACPELCARVMPRCGGVAQLPASRAAAFDGAFASAPPPSSSPQLPALPQLPQLPLQLGWPLAGLLPGWPPTLPNLPPTQPPSIWANGQPPPSSPTRPSPSAQVPPGDYLIINIFYF